MTIKIQMVADVAYIQSTYDEQLDRLNDLLRRHGFSNKPAPGNIEEGPPVFPPNIYNMVPQKLSEWQTIYQRWLEYYTAQAAHAKVKYTIGKELLRALEAVIRTTIPKGTEKAKECTMRSDKRHIQAMQKLKIGETEYYMLMTQVNLMDSHLKLLSRTISLKETELTNFKREQNVQGLRYAGGGFNNPTPGNPHSM